MSLKLSDHRERIIEWLLRNTQSAEVRASLEQGFKPTKAIEAVESYLPQVCQEGRLLVLAGPPGRGKTFAAEYAIAATAVWSSYWQAQGFIITAPDLYRLSINDEYRYERIIGMPELLVLDELGAEHKSKSEFFKSLLDSIFNERWTARKPTLVTTNYSQGDFDNEYGARVASRRKGWGWWVEIGKSHEDLRTEPKRTRSTLDVWVPPAEDVRTNPPR